MVSATMLFRTWLRKRFVLRREVYSFKVTTILNILFYGRLFMHFYKTDPMVSSIIYYIYYKMVGI